MSIEPYRTGTTINLEDGENIKEAKIKNDTGKLAVMEFVGINAFSQKEQGLYFSIQVNTGIYPVAVCGNALFSDPELPMRVFGSQFIKLYIDPEVEFTLTLARDKTNGLARAMIALSGQLIPPVM